MRVYQTMLVEFVNMNDMDVKSTSVKRLYDRLNEKTTR